jgi:hypothetical protein
MKRTVLLFVIGALILAGLVLWAVQGRLAGNIGEILQAGVVLVLVGFALYLGVSRLRSHKLREPAEDEMTKNVMRRASSLAFYVSIYLWLFVMYVSDKTKLETHTLVGAGILGMAVVFLLSWLGVRMFGVKND